jgi:hypothetical protein
MFFTIEIIGKFIMRISSRRDRQTIELVEFSCDGNTLIQIYLFVCQIYDTYSDTCFQRLSNNNEPDFTDR